MLTLHRNWQFSWDFYIPNRNTGPKPKCKNFSPRGVFHHPYCWLLANRLFEFISSAASEKARWDRLQVKSSSLPLRVLSDELLGSTDKDWLFLLQKASAARGEPASEHNLNREPQGWWASDSQRRLHAWTRANPVPNALIIRGRFHQAREALVT